MPTVCRNFAFPPCTGAPAGVGYALLARSSPQLRLSQLLDVVHHAVQVPLRVDFGATPVVEARQALVVPDVAKHRLHCADALAVELAPLR